jgi:hypothetical protein
MRHFKAMRLLVRRIESENQVDKTRDTIRIRVREPVHTGADHTGELRLLQYAVCEDGG